MAFETVLKNLQNINFQKFVNSIFNYFYKISKITLETRK